MHTDEGGLGDGTELGRMPVMTEDGRLILDRTHLCRVRRQIVSDRTGSVIGDLTAEADMSDRWEGYIHEICQATGIVYDSAGRELARLYRDHEEVSDLLRCATGTPRTPPSLLTKGHL